MPSRRKPFIDKKKATKYRLIPGFVPDHDDSHSDVLQQTEEEIDKRKEEQREFGIFYDDNYDYTQHLRSLTEGATMVKESDLTNTEDELRSSYGGSVNFRIFSTEKEVKEERIDADILASLDEAPEVKMTEDGDIEYTDGMDFLEDDFISQAGGYEPKPEQPEDTGHYLYDLEEQDVGSDFDDLSDAHSDFDEDEESEEEDCSTTDGMPHRLGRGTVQDDIIEAQTALILKNFQEGLGFSCMAQQMDEDDERATTEDYENLKEILIQEKWKKDNIMTATDFLNNHADRPNFDYSKFANESEVKEEEFEWKDLPPSKPKFDCVSILSLNSNTRNLPTDIIVPSVQKRRSKQTSTCDSEEASVGLSRRELEEEMRLSRKADRASTFRPQDETAEEKKNRKKAIRDERKERRQEKKANQMVFSMEKQKMDKELASLSKSGKGIKLS